MNTFKKLTGNVVIFVQVLIVFVLFFENSISLPAWLQSFGRMHPLLLHLPIGLLLITAVLIFTRRHFESPSFDDLISFLLYLTSLTASLTTLMGLFLSLEGGYDNEAIAVHKWAGVIVSFLCASLIISPRSQLLKPAIAFAVVTLIVAGHYGATITHGEQMVLEPIFRNEQQARVITDSSTVFHATVESIFEAKCSSCHNESKAKGRLILTSKESVLKGGKHGKLWVAGHPEKSLMMERLLLPLDAKEHMPPRDKAQLSNEELDFLTLWIQSGADTEKRIAQLPPTDTLRQLASAVISGYSSHKINAPLYKFEFASNDKVAKLNAPYRSLFRIAENEPALEADFYLKQSYRKEYLDELVAVKDQLVALNLSNMPVEDSDLETISKFKNLRKLVLNNTNIKGTNLASLTRMNSLESVSLSGAPISTESLAALSQSKTIRNVYVWNTSISKQDAENLKVKFPNITWHSGYVPDETEILKLNAPLLRNESNLLAGDEVILLKHNLPGTTIRYTTDGTDPDSVKSPVFEKSIVIDKYTIVKTKAFKDGWRSSDPAEYVFFKKGIKASKAELLTSAEPKYEGEGIATLTNEQKGMPDFYKDPSWVGFRSRPLIALFTFDGTQTISSVTLSHARNVWAMCMAPAEVQVWAGDDANNLRLIKKTIPVQPTTWVSNRTEGTLVEFPPSNYKVFKLVATPLARLPEFRNEKKEKGWLMVDEVFFN
jgi:hypothetical protein